MLLRLNAPPLNRSNTVNNQSQMKGLGLNSILIHFSLFIRGLVGQVELDKNPPLMTDDVLGQNLPHAYKKV